MRTYEKEEKQALLEEYKSSGKGINAFAEEKGIPSTTLRDWVKEDNNLTFGSIEIKGSSLPIPRKIKPTTVFATENIRIELKEGYNQKLLKVVIGVMLDD